MTESTPKVYLVGAGPGRADLITLRGAELIKCADCIIYDRLVNPDLLTLAKADAEIIHTPKRTGPTSVAQGLINELMVEKALDGKTVIRLKGGDPCVFGRGAEEARILAAAGIEFEIVPGVTAAVAAAEYSGIMLTDRAYSSQVTFITGHEAEGKSESAIDWHLLAKFNGSIVFYMGMTNLGFIAKQLIENGMSADTPAAAIQNATLPIQRKLCATVGTIAAECEKQQIEPPAIIVIGTAAKADNSLDWFGRLPLFGQTIVTTRDKKGNADFAAKIIAQGGNPIKFDSIKIKPFTDKSEFLKTLTRLSEYHWVIFTSANGVNIFFDCLQILNKDARVFAHAKVAAVGPNTAAALKRHAIIPDFVPTIFTREQLGKQLIAAAELKGKAVCLLCSQEATDQLKQILAVAGASVDQTSVYSVETQKCDCARIKDLLDVGRIDWLTFASPSAAESFFEQIDPGAVKSAKTRIASIGPVTGARLKDIGLTVHTEAAEHTIDGVIEAIKTYSRI